MRGCRHTGQAFPAATAFLAAMWGLATARSPSALAVEAFAPPSSRYSTADSDDVEFTVSQQRPEVLRQRRAVALCRCNSECRIGKG